MTNIEKNGVVMAARDNHQLAAFLNNGWKIMEERHEDDKQKESIPLSDDDIAFEERQQSYTKSDINRMKTEDLQNLAFNIGLKNAYDMTGAELKKVLIEHFGL